MLALIYVSLIAVAVLMLGLLSLRKKNDNQSGLVFSFLALCVIVWLIGNQVGRDRKSVV